MRPMLLKALIVIVTIVVILFLDLDIVKGRASAIGIGGCET